VAHLRLRCGGESQSAGGEQLLANFSVALLRGEKIYRRGRSNYLSKLLNALPLDTEGRGKRKGEGGTNNVFCPKRGYHFRKTGGGRRKKNRLSLLVLRDCGQRVRERREVKNRQ